jgi:rod shape-determining protein MreC
MTKLQTRSFLVVLLVAASLGLLGLNQSGTLEPVKGVLLVPLTALQGWVARTFAGAVGFFQADPDVEALRQRNAELEQQLALLQARVVELEETESDLRILSGLLNYARTQPDSRYLAANVIGRDPSPFLSFVLLDRGSDHGVMRDMPVVTDQGLVGRVVEVNCCASKVQLVIDPASAVNARLQQSRERGVAVGRLGGGLSLQFISQQASMQPGELVLTSGMGGLYPPDIILGTVSAVQRLDYEVLQSADVTPAVDFNRLEIVLIITNFRPIDLSPLLQATPASAAP